RGLAPSGRATLPRITRGARSMCREPFALRADDARSPMSRAASSPTSRIGWRTVVSGGSNTLDTGMSSKPTTDTSSGTRMPRARSVPMAVEPRPRRRPVERTGDRRDRAVLLRYEVGRRLMTAAAVVDVHVIRAGEIDVRRHEHRGNPRDSIGEEIVLREPQPRD